MVPIQNKPIIEILIDQLIKHQFQHITICLGHQSHIIKEYFDKKKFKIKIDFTLKKTVGNHWPLKLIDDLPEDFLLMNGDILTDLNFSRIFKNT